MANLLDGKSSLSLLVMAKLIRHNLRIHLPGQVGLKLTMGQDFKIGDIKRVVGLWA